MVNGKTVNYRIKTSIAPHDWLIDWRPSSCCQCVDEFRFRLAFLVDLQSSSIATK
jgi:hypothetical protein